MRSLCISILLLSACSGHSLTNTTWVESRNGIQIVSRFEGDGTFTFKGEHRGVAVTLSGTWKDKSLTVLATKKDIGSKRTYALHGYECVSLLGVEQQDDLCYRAEGTHAFTVGNEELVMDVIMTVAAAVEATQGQSPTQKLTPQ